MTKGADYRKTEVVLKMLVDCGMLSPGAELLSDNPDARAILNSDGSIKVIFEGNEKLFSYPSGAARYVEKKSLNGWAYWFLLCNGEKRYLSSFRDEYYRNKKTED